VPPSVKRDQEIGLSWSKRDLLAPQNCFRSSKEQKRPTGRRAKETYWQGLPPGTAYGLPGTAARSGLSRKSNSHILPWAAPPPPLPAAAAAAAAAAAVGTARTHAPHATAVCMYVCMHLLLLVRNQVCGRSLLLHDGSLLLHDRPTSRRTTNKERCTHTYYSLTHTYYSLTCWYSALSRSSCDRSWYARARARSLSLSHTLSFTHTHAPHATAPSRCCSHKKKKSEKVSALACFPIRKKYI